MSATDRERDPAAHGHFPRLAVGPRNQAGQANAWALAVRRHLGLRAFSFASDGPAASRLAGGSFEDRSDHPVPHARLSTAKYRSRRVRKLLAHVTHLLDESNLAVFGDARTATFEDELSSVVDAGVTPALVFHGSELRRPTRHADEHSYSFFHDVPSEWFEQMEEITRQTAELIERVDLPLFVSTPDLLADAPSATLLPLVVDVDHWVPSGTPLGVERPRVLHLPSRRVPAIKGTDHIEPVLDRLDRQGLITWVRSGEVGHAQVRALVATADIVVDQIQTGSYGVAAIEAMASGKVVVGNLSPWVRRSIEDPIPIVDASPPDFEEVMIELIDSPDRIQRMGHDARSFVECWHDGRKSAEVLQSWMDRPA